MPPIKSTAQRRRKSPQNIYDSAILERSIILPIQNIGKTLSSTMEKVVSAQIEGKCTVEGFIKPGSIQLVTYSSGVIREDKVKFEVVFECQVCLPVEGMLINCRATNITKAGIRAETTDEISPVIIFIARDHHYMSSYFTSVKEGADIVVRVIGQRYELNDKYISVIAELVEPRDEKMKRKRKPRLIVSEK